MGECKYFDDPDEPMQLIIDKDRFPTFADLDGEIVVVECNGKQANLVVVSTTNLGGDRVALSSKAIEYFDLEEKIDWDYYDFEYDEDTVENLGYIFAEIIYISVLKATSEVTDNTPTDSAYMLVKNVKMIPLPSTGEAGILLLIIIAVGAAIAAASRRRNEKHDTVVAAI